MKVFQPYIMSKNLLPYKLHEISNQFFVKDVKMKKYLVEYNVYDVS